MQMPVFSRLSAYAVAAGTLLAGTGAAMAELGQPAPWQLGLQESASPVMTDITTPPTKLMCACASGSIMCPGPPAGLPIESSHARIGGSTCSMPWIVPISSAVAETPKNLTRLRW